MDVSIVIPTYNERDNVRIIVERIRNTLAECNYMYEIIFVDDSKDDTSQVLEQLARQYTEVKYIHRQNETGLASAVVQGFRIACGQHIIVMDADLQHPPELIPLLVKRLAQADIVIPSRFIEGGSDGGLNLLRKLISWTARVIGQMALTRLRGISDCTSGYFGVNSTVIKDAVLDPIGWKILMEVLVKGHYLSVHEIPYTFVARDAGQSKMTMREQWNYLRHIARLVGGSPDDRRFYLFCIIGALGVIINLLSLSALLKIFPDGGLTVSFAACFVAMIHNFFWHDNVTWRGHKRTGFWQRMWQFPQFVFVSLTGIITTVCFAYVFLLFNWNLLAGQLIGIAAATCWNYGANSKWTWAGDKTNANKRTTLVVTQEYDGKMS